MKYRIKLVNAYYQSYYLAQWSLWGLFWHSIESYSSGWPKEYDSTEGAMKVINHNVEWRRNRKGYIVFTRET